MADDPPAAGSPALAFAAAARALTAAARQLSLVPPTFRTPPRLVGVDRSVRRRASGAGGTEGSQNACDEPNENTGSRFPSRDGDSGKATSMRAT